MYNDSLEGRAFYLDQAISQMVEAAIALREAERMLPAVALRIETLDRRFERLERRAGRVPLVGGWICGRLLARHRAARAPWRNQQDIYRRTIGEARVRVETNRRAIHDALLGGQGRRPVPMPAAMEAALREEWR